MMRFTPPTVINTVKEVYNSQTQGGGDFDKQGGAQ